MSVNIFIEKTFARSYPGNQGVISLNSTYFLTKMKFSSKIGCYNFHCDLPDNYCRMCVCLHTCMLPSNLCHFEIWKLLLKL